MTSKINLAWGATSAILKTKFTFDNIKEIVNLAGFDYSQISHLVQGSASKPTKGKLISVIEQKLCEFSDEEKLHFINIVVEEMLDRDSTVEEKLEQYLSRLGWKIIDNQVIPIEILDKNDLLELDEISRKELLKSAKRFRDGDLSGALTAACGAIDSLTNQIYQNNNLGDATKASFQERCKVALKTVGVFEAITNELSDIEWKESGVTPFNKNFEGALNQAAYVMQSLRANMSDVHGTKPVLKPLIFDSIKWTQIIVRLLSEKNYSS